MKNLPSFVRFLLLPAILLATGVSGFSYESPNFEASPFDADGIFLEPSEKDSLLEALAAIASNFDEKQEIDDDLKEKALGIALRLDPFHFSSRTAHRALRNGVRPSSTTFFQSLSAVSEALWSTGERMMEAPLEPEHARLGPLLLELSLLTHPSPPEERIVAYAGIQEAEPAGWGKLVNLQSDSTSTTRARMLIREGKEILTSPSTEEPKMTAPTEPTSPASDPTMQPKAKGSKEDRPERVRIAIPYLAVVKAVDTAPTIGEFSLVFRRPENQSEAELFPFVGKVPPTGYDTLPFLSSVRGVAIDDLDFPAEVLAETGWEFPPEAIAVAEYETTSILPGPRRLTRTRGRLPVIMLMNGLAAEVEPNPSFLFAGEVDTAGEISLPGPSFPLAQAADGDSRPFLLLPATALPDLVESLLASEDLEPLFSPELVAYESAEELSTILFSSPDENLVAASEEFAEIYAVSTRMPLPDLARNAKVQERLVEILKRYPKHLSARAMLEFGQKPPSLSAQLKVAIAKIDTILAPLLALSDPDADLNNARNRIDEIDAELAQIRTEVPAEVRDYLFYASELHDAAESYLGLTNLGTSIADQRLRELQASIEDLKSEKAKLVID